MKTAKIIRTIIFFIILSAMLAAMSYVFMKKESRHYKYQFLNSDRQYDALFFGSSHVHEGVDPAVLWNDFGIRSYNLASAGESVQLTQYVLREALEKTTPKVVFIDSFKISDGDSLDQTYSFVHESIDAFPLNKIKLEAIDYAGDMLDKNKFSFISNIYAYHGRYGELGRQDFTNEYTFDKGAYIMTSVVPAKEPALTGTEEAAELNGGRGIAAYENILKLCKDKGIKCVLLSVPMKEGRFDEKYFNALKNLTESYGGSCIEGNSLKDEIGLDYACDFGDTESHLNLLGAKKFTDYIGRYLKDELSIGDIRQSDPSEAELWDADIARWSYQKADMLKDKQDAVSYLFGIYDPLYKAEVYVRDKTLIDEHYGLKLCLEKLGVSPQEAEGETLGSSAYDMRIRVMNAKSGDQIAEQYFTFDKERKIFRTDV